MNKFLLIILMVFTTNTLFAQKSGIGKFTSTEDKVTIYYAGIEALASIQFSSSNTDKENGIIQAEGTSSTNQSKALKLFVSIRIKKEKTLMKVTLTRPQGAKDDLKAMLEDYSNSIKETIPDLEIEIDVPEDKIIADNTIKKDRVEENNIKEETHLNKKKSLTDKTRGIWSKTKNSFSKAKDKVMNKTDDNSQVQIDVINIVQESSVVPIPEFSARVYYLNNNELNDLERVSATVDVKVKAFGYKGADVFLTAFNSQSNIKFSSNNIPRFIIRIEGNIDPEDVLTIVSKSPSKKKDRRRFKIASQTLTGRSRDISDNEVTYSVKRVRDNIYEIFFEDHLASGEYAILPISDKETNLSNSTKVKITCFSIN